MNSREFKDYVYDQLSKITKSLSSPKRMELLDLLTQGPKTVESLVSNTQMSIAIVSQHLKVLHEARIVRYTKKGTYVIYSISEPDVYSLIISLRHISEKQYAELRQIKDDFLHARDHYEPITLVDLKLKMEQEDIILLDVRPSDEYEAGHIPRAINVPIQELHHHLSLIPKGKEVIAYCRGPYCLYALEATELLKEHGIRAFRIEEGYQEWRIHAGVTH
ncbi:MAG: metalloregulator ArsR/SmtB family transcription factor [Bacilli bacterium]